MSSPQSSTANYAWVLTSHCLIREAYRFGCSLDTLSGRQVLGFYKRLLCECEICKLLALGESGSIKSGTFVQVSIDKSCRGVSAL